jgi:L-asparaginase
MKNSVLLIYTGGTIGMVKGSDGSLQPFDFDNFTAEIPELKKLEVQLDSIAFDEPIDSSNMQPSIWSKLAKLIETHYHSYDGFVILHGSDTMAYSASALSFLLENLDKAVIFTGSQLPIGIRRTDAKENLITSIEIAASGQCREVAVYFEYKLMRGNRTVKVNAEHFEAFQSPNYPALAEAGVNIKYHSSYKPCHKDLIAHQEMAEEVAVLKLFPGINKASVEALLQSKNKAVVIETYGAGNAPTQSWFVEAIKAALAEGKVILNVSQCLAGSVNQNLYETGKQLSALGVISGGDMTTEAAVTKLMFLLAQRMSKDELQEQLQKSLRGEVSN